MYISRLEIKKMSVLPHISSLHFSFNQPERKTETGLAGMHMTPEKHKDKKRQESTGYTVRVGWISLCFLVFTAA